MRMIDLLELLKEEIKRKFLPRLAKELAGGIRRAREQGQHV